MIDLRYVHSFMTVTLDTRIILIFQPTSPPQGGALSYAIQQICGTLFHALLSIVLAYELLRGS